MMRTDTRQMDAPQGFWECLMAFGLGGVGRVLRDWQYARQRRKRIHLADLIPAGLYSGMMAVVICLAARWYLPQTVNTTLIALFSILAGVGAVDLAGVGRELLLQFAARLAPLQSSKDKQDGNE